MAVAFTHFPHIKQATFCNSYVFCMLASLQYWNAVVQFIEYSRSLICLVEDLCNWQLHELSLCMGIQKCNPVSAFKSIFHWITFTILQSWKKFKIVQSCSGFFKVSDPWPDQGELYSPAVCAAPTKAVMKKDVNGGGQEMAVMVMSYLYIWRQLSLNEHHHVMWSLLVSGNWVTCGSTFECPFYGLSVTCFWSHKPGSTVKLIMLLLWLLGSIWVQPC